MGLWPLDRHSWAHYQNLVGKPLLQFEKDNLLGPLGMTDTSFFVSDPAKYKMIAQPMPDDSAFRVGFESNPEVPRKWESGGGGMLSTMADYARFSQMLLNGGSFDGHKYFRPKGY